MPDRIIGPAVRRLIDYFFPALCIVCDRPRIQREPWLCDACAGSLRENISRRNPCPKCAMDRRLGPCACTQGWAQPFQGMHAICNFDPVMQALLHQVKYRSKKQLAIDLGVRLGAYLPPRFFDGIDAIVPVPLHPGRLKKRGYNQSLLFARGIAAVSEGLPLYHDVLLRVKNTPSQTALDRQQRKRNLDAAFRAAAGASVVLKDKRLLLVDDVVTTGATTGAAAGALLDAGCRSVRVLAIARD